MTSTINRRPQPLRPAHLAGRVRALGTALAALAVTLVGSQPAAAQQTGVMQTATNTIPRGAIFMADANGGHWWVSDQVQGVCELIPQNVNGQPPFARQNCNGTANAGGELVAGNPAASLGLPAGSKFLYVADSSTTSVKVVRFVFSPSGNGSLGTNTQMTVSNLTSVGGGAGGGRTVGLALTPHNGLAPNGGTQDLYVGYLKSGDIMRIDGVDAVALNNQTPSVTKAGSTSDGKGINSLLMFGNDLYIAELGGFGMSRIADPSGITRPACSTANPCTAVSLSPNPSALAGGLATDWTSGSTAGKVIYIGDSRLGGVTNYILAYDPAVGSTKTASTAITPSYVEGTTFTSYSNPLGLGFNAANGDLLVGDDPQASVAVPTAQQGHTWKFAPKQPTVTAISPANGLLAGGTIVTITGTNFIVGATTFKFGANASATVACASTTSCTATSPAGNAGTVDVIASNANGTSAATLADKFTYSASLIPSITSVTPNTGPITGGTAVTIAGTNFIVGATTFAFGGTAATGVACASSTSCTAVSPAHASGTVDVIATDANGTSAAVSADRFNYVNVPTVTAVAPPGGSTLGGTIVTITGTDFITATGTPGVTGIRFGANAATGVACATTTSCTATSPAGAAGTVDVTVTTTFGTSAVSLADKFTYSSISVTSVAPNSGATSGGTVVTITGTNFAIGATTVRFGANAATAVTCATTTSCTATSPAAAAAGVVDVTVTTAAGTSSIVAADQFTYSTPTASLFAWGITAPKGGATFIPGALGGHWWSSDHAQGICRQDPMSTAPAPFSVPGSTLNAINFATCGSVLVGSAGQAVYDPRVNAIGLGTVAGTHYVYVPDNAVKSTAVWRLTFDPATETMVPDPADGITMATAMAPLADQRTLKPNGMALGPDGNLYVSDLTDPYVRVLTNPNADPRTQAIGVVAETGDARGSNGTQGFIGNYLYISGNRASQFFDITLCPSVGNTTDPGGLTGTPCGMASVPAPAGVFVAGTITDAPNKRVYLSNSAGGGPAAIYRYDASHDVYVKFPWNFYGTDLFGVVHCAACTFGPDAVPYIQGGNLPAPGTANGTVTVALTMQRPWDQTNHSTVGIAPGLPVPTTFAFVFGLGIDPAGNLAITEDPSAGARSGRGTMWIVPFLN